MLVEEGAKLKKCFDIFLPLKAEEPDPIWVAKHVHQHRYGMQIVKCLDETCCEKFETNWLDIFKKRFMPFPAVYQYGQSGVEIVEPSVYFKNKRKYRFATLSERLINNRLVPTEENGQTRSIPFDTYCESMQGKFDECICTKCGSYWPSKTQKLRHMKAHKLGLPNENLEIMEDLDEIEAESVVEEVEEDCGPMPVFDKSHVLSPFVEIKDGQDSESESDSE